MAAATFHDNNYPAYNDYITDNDDHHDDQSFCDVAFAAAKAMESIDMDALCGEIFSQELFERNGNCGGISSNALMTSMTPEHLEHMSAGCTTTATAADMSVGDGNSNTCVVSPVLKALPPFSQSQPASSTGGVTATGGAWLTASATPSTKKSVPLTIAVPQQTSTSTTSPVASTATPAAAASVSCDLATCVRCNFAGADVRIQGCPNRCSYHARCIDLLALTSPNGGISSTMNNNKNNKSSGTEFCLRQCPHCAAPSSGLEMLPLSFVEMDRAHQQVHFEKSAAANNSFAGFQIRNRANSTGGAMINSTTSSKKRSYSEVDDAATFLSSSGSASNNNHTVSSANVGGDSGIPCYDPSVPRTGRWAEEEIAFRDAIISQFLEGSLPLAKGLKLNDFLPNILKSKQSRLAKKMKNAKLSTKFFFPQTGHVEGEDKARELSRLESCFVRGIGDPVERAEIQFHMQREWREHLAERCAVLGIPFEASQWLQSVDTMDRRLAMEKNHSRMVRRRFMMGKAMEKDVSESLPGIFIEKEDVMEDLDMALEASVLNSSEGHAIKQSQAPQVTSCAESNFKHASPFLACVTSYMERNSIPFEHVDAWIPSYSSSTDGPSGSNSNSSESNFRLSFGGSATINAQLVNDPEAASTATSPSAPMKRVPLTTEEKLYFSLFGDYSEKFSFSSGCGLPGRVFQSGTPAWEQFISNADPSMFERRGGAMQFGVKTALALPIESPNVGRIVLVMYSKHNRENDKGLVQRIVNDMKVLNPSPRWKLVVDVGSSLAVSPNAPAISGLSRPPVESCPVQVQQQQPTVNTVIQRQDSSCSVSSVITEKTKDDQIKDLILLLGENIPSDHTSLLGQQLHSIMTLRLILLRSDRSAEEHQLVDTILVLFESYLAAGRARSDIAIMVARDFSFHLQHQQQMSWMTQPQPQHPQPPSVMHHRQVMSPLMSPVMQSQQQPQHHRQHPYHHHPGYAPSPMIPNFSRNNSAGSEYQCSPRSAISR